MIACAIIDHGPLTLGVALHISVKPVNSIPVAHLLQK
jgi:hypothetical protein